ncbi:PIG-L family deacetylase [Laceyella putida]|uniref:PIG-L family deacetylase n=1 Tax=Laceyella putida TaxID=110101 RepID=A0ABW2RJF1_9BACL
MRKVASMLLLVGLLLVLPAQSPSSAAMLNVIDSSSNVAVYLVPHADDEVLSFGVPILNDLRAGKKVYMVLFSPGEDSIAREVINGKADEETVSSAYKPGDPVRCAWHARYHDPVAEGYLHGHVTKEEFGQARIDEFYLASQEMGVPRANLKTSILPNGQFTYDSVKSIILTYDRLFPNAQFKTFSSVDLHVDHALIGKVLDDMYAEGRINKPQTNIVSIATDRFHSHGDETEVPGYKLYLTDSADKVKLQNAVNHVYKGWDPHNGVYGLGYHSVPAQFDALLADTYTKIAAY